MIFAYDLRYVGDHFAGIGTFTFALLEELLELPGDERYLLLWDPRQPVTRFDLGRFRAHPRVEWVERHYDPTDARSVMSVGAWLRRAKPAVYFSPFSLRPVFSRCPEVLTLHDVTPLRVRHIPSRYRFQLYRLSLRHALRARFILTVSQFSRQEILSLTHVRPERVRVALAGVAPWGPGLKPRRPAALTEDRFALLVGDNRPRKNHEVVASAWAALGPAPPLALVAAGPVDPRFTSLEDLARRTGARRIVQLGWVEPAELAWLYAHAEILLFPSVYEGFGSPLVEAFAHGLPVLASDIPVFHEVGAEAAVYVDPRDPAAWASAVLRLTGDSGEREHLRQAGLARAAELTYRKTAETTLAVLREAAGVQT